MVGGELTLTGDVGDLWFDYQADPIRTAIGMVDGRDWQVEQRRGGRTASSLLAVGLGPVPQDKKRSTLEMLAAIVEREGAGVTEIDF